jgi:hypothetical protein
MTKHSEATESAQLMEKLMKADATAPVVNDGDKSNASRSAAPASNIPPLEAVHNLMMPPYMGTYQRHRVSAIEFGSGMSAQAQSFEPCNFMTDQAQMTYPTAVDASCGSAFMTPREYPNQEAELRRLNTQLQQLDDKNRGLRNGEKRLEADVRRLRDVNKDLESKHRVLLHQNEMAAYNAREDARRLAEKNPDTGKSQTESTNLKRQLDKTMKEHEALNKKLEECKARLFKMQPVQLFTEDEICQQYTGLCGAIDDWAEESFGHVDDLDLRQVLTPLQNTGAVWDHIEHYVKKPGVLELLSRRDDSNFHVVQYLIVRIIYEQLWEKTMWLPGMQSRDQQLLEGIIESMRYLKPLRGKQACTYLDIANNF